MPLVDRIGHDPLCAQVSAAVEIKPNTHRGSGGKIKRPRGWLDARERHKSPLNTLFYRCLKYSDDSPSKHWRSMSHWIDRKAGLERLYGSQIRSNRRKISYGLIFNSGADTGYIRPDVAFRRGCVPCRARDPGG